MAKVKKSTPGDHLLDCLRAPKRALTQAGKGRIPLMETVFVAVLGLVGVGWAGSGMLLADSGAFERFVLGGLQGLALVVPLCLFIGAANALQPSGPGSQVTMKQSLGIAATAVVGPGVFAMLCGVLSLVGPMFGQSEMVMMSLAMLPAAGWLVGLVGMTGVGHAMSRSSSPVVGVASAVGAMLVTALAAGLAVAIYLNPPWATDQPWGFL